MACQEDSRRPRFEARILELLHRTVGDEQKDAIARFQLTLNALNTVTISPKLLDCLSNPKECFRYKPPVLTVIPPPCKTLVNHFVARGFVNSVQANALTTLEVPLLMVAPSLLRNIAPRAKLSSDQIVAFLDQAASAGGLVGKPHPDDDDYCREHPQDPLCWVMASRLLDGAAQQTGAEMVLTWRLYEQKLIDHGTFKNVIGFYHDVLTADATDMTLDSATKLVEVYADAPAAAALTTTLASGAVGDFAPGSPIPPECQPPNPEPWCTRAREAGMASLLTQALIEHKLLPADAMSHVFR